MKHCTISEAKAKLNSLISSREHVGLTIHGKVKAVIVPYEEYITMYRSLREKEDNEAIAKAEEHFRSQKNAES